VQSLLEKALKARSGSDETSGAKPGFLAPTKAFEVQSVPNKRKEENVKLTEEEQRQLEDEKKEQIGAIRRKFKEKNKQILRALMEKKKMVDKKVSRRQRYLHALGN